MENVKLQTATQFTVSQSFLNTLGNNTNLKPFGIKCIHTLFIESLDQFYSMQFKSWKENENGN